MPNVSLHWFLGQSNGLGASPDGSAPIPTFPPYENYCGYKSGRALRPATLGIPGAGAGSPMYHLLNRWYELSGERAIGIMSNEGGTGLLQAAGGSGTWQVGAPGSLYEVAALQMRRVAEGIRMSPNLSVTRVFTHWIQGEQDASVTHGDTVNGPLYQSALQVIHNRVRGDLAAAGLPFGKFCVYETGYRVSSPSSPEWAAIRLAQRNFVAANPTTTIMAFDKAKEQGPLVTNSSGDWISGWALMDDVHYTAAAWRCTGRGGATSAYNSTL